jgi:Tfp pilus assembly protein PilF
MTRHVLRGALATAIALIVGLAAPAYAQNGSLRGKVVDQDGRGVPDIEVVLDFVGPYTRQVKAITDKNGEWFRAGMPAGQGTWTITVKRGKLEGRATGVNVVLGDLTRVPDIMLAEPGASPSAAPKGMSQEEIEKNNKRQAMLEGLLNEAKVAMEAKEHDVAIAKLTQLATEVPTCGECHAQLGDVHMNKNDLDAAEKAYLQAIAINPKLSAPYEMLATIYNTQRKLDEAAKMSAKAAELAEASGTGGSASAFYNAGVVMWNQGKGPEAQAQFEKAIKLDPKMADAHFLLGMALVNQGKMKEAKAPFEEYLKLDPNGSNAATAKAILAQIK